VKQLIVFIFLIIFLQGCSTNNIVDAKKIKQANMLTAKSEEIEKQIEAVEIEKNTEIDNLQKELLNLQKEIKQQTGEDNISLTRTESGIKLTILEEVLFDSGKSEINQNGKEVLSKVAGFLKEANKNIQVVGHTDNTPIKKTANLYKSNWDLSAKRAINVIYIFEAQGVLPAKMCAVGYGEYMPIETNDTQEGRKKNRRVEIIVSDDVAV